MTDHKPLLQLAAELGDALQLRQWRVATAESCTGGGIAAAITAIPGSSNWFEYGLVTYANAAKQHLLGVDSETLSNEGAVSENVVRQMAAGTLSLTGADIAVAVSGIAGPGGGSAEKPVGTVWFAWAIAKTELAMRPRTPQRRQNEQAGSRSRRSEGNNLEFLRRSAGLDADAKELLRSLSKTVERHLAALGRPGEKKKQHGLHEPGRLRSARRQNLDRLRKSGSRGDCDSW